MWRFPLKEWCGFIPQSPHPGSFGAVRKHDVHCGVDLYVPDEVPVHAVEDGIVVAIEEYTGPKAESPWWLPTQAILVEGVSGVVCYGEVKPHNLTEGAKVVARQHIAHVAPVLGEHKVRPDILHHSRFMLHFELYEHGTDESVWWYKDDEKPSNLLDPTQKLLDSLGVNSFIL